jgi:hypothetical protein
MRLYELNANDQHCLIPSSSSTTTDSITDFIFALMISDNYARVNRVQFDAYLLNVVCRDDCWYQQSSTID